MRLAKHLGLSVANVETILVDRRPVLVVERYDRIVDPDGTVHRVHQEDFCQALGLPEIEYEQDADQAGAHRACPTGLRRAISPATLLRALALNVALGNCDAHGKNFSLLHTQAGGAATGAAV